MNYHSFADMGGCASTQAVHPEPDGAAFHAHWEPRAMALTVAMGATGLWNIDQSRAMRETLSEYARLEYYQIWLTALEKLVQASGILDKPAPQAPLKLRAVDVAATLKRGSPTLRRQSTPARFAVGQRVRTLAGEFNHHTRLPAYARGKVGTVERIHGAHVYADSNAQRLGESPQWLYTVAFEAATLWAEPTLSQIVSVDAFEPYLSAEITPAR